MDLADWDPDLYARFAAQRLAPFEDLLSLLPPGLGPRWVDLGCGDGRPTLRALERLGTDATRVVALDTSAAMLTAARALGEPRLTCRQGDLGAWARDDTALWDLVLSNAALHWVDDHATVTGQLAARVAPGGWLAFQIPMNHTAPTHVLMAETASRSPFADALHGYRKAWPQRSADDYARWLDGAGLTHVISELRTYRHPVPGPAAIAAWTRSTGLRPWLERLPEALREPFVTAYTAALAEAYPPVDDAGTCLLDYRRLLVVGHRPH